MVLVTLWLLFAILIGVAAKARGRFGIGWFLLAILLSPLIAGVILALLPDLRTQALLEEIRGAGSVNEREVLSDKRGR